MKIASAVLAIALVSSSLLRADNTKLTQKAVDDFYAMCWRELSTNPPKLETPSPKIMERELKGRFTYEYLDPISGHTNKGAITFHYPKWDWPSDESKGSAKQFGDKITLLGNGDESQLRAFLLRIKGRWHIMQMDFPGGLVELKGAEPGGPANGSQPVRPKTNSTPSSARSRR